MASNRHSFFAPQGVTPPCIQQLISTVLLQSLPTKRLWSAVFSQARIAACFIPRLAASRVAL